MAVPTKKLKKEMYPIPDLGNVVKMPIDDVFGIVSDTHFGSIMEGVRELEILYDDFADRGIKQVFHAGDLTDGESVYRGHKRYVKDHGYEAQALWTVKKYPEKKDMKTYIIAGNHDTSFFIRSGADIVKYICSYRSDLEYVGLFYARFKDGKLKLDMLHPRGGVYYSKSYAIQKYIRNNEMPETYPDVMIFGHYHQHGYFADHGIDCILAGNFMHPNEWMIRRGFVGDLGGFIIELDRERNKLKGIKVEWRGK